MGLPERLGVPSGRLGWKGMKMEKQPQFTDTTSTAKMTKAPKGRAELVADYYRELRADARMPRAVRRQLLRDFEKELRKAGVN